MAKIFINYRSSDTASMAVLLQSRIAAAFGNKAVFRDDGSILVGTDFQKRILEELATCVVMLVVIGPDWLATDKDGLTKLHAEDDWVRFEIIEALRNGMNVAPLLVNGSGRLDPQTLPEPLRPLTKRQYRYIRERSALDDIEALIDELAELTELERIDGNPGPTTSVNVRQNTGILAVGNGNQSTQHVYQAPPPAGPR